MGLGRAGSRRAIALAVLVAACGFALPAPAQPAGDATADAAQNRVWCENRQRTFAPDQRIKGCTALVAVITATSARPSTTCATA